ncbi:hypothetical protein KAS31_00180 [Candidatus Parcubacteria bacterium]|nr:hypothetical protein [Candidatus Parcubacteria bacterium]
MELILYYKLKRNVKEEKKAMKQKRMKPYIGITGFMNQQEITSILNLMPESSNRLLMVGVLASLKTIKSLPNKWPNRYPKIGDIMNIFPEHPLALNLLHYNTKEPATLYEQLVEITELGIENLHGFQLNIPWPDPVELGKYRSLYPDMQIVLQIGGQAFQEVENSPDCLATYVPEYRGVVEYILLDPSGGTGTLLDMKEIRGYLEVISEERLGMGIGIAGGLSSTTLNLIEPLLEEFPRLSIDAEGRLRDQNDSLNLNLAGKYLHESLKMFANI